MTKTEEIFEYLKWRFEDANLVYHPANSGQPWIIISAPFIREISHFLRDDMELRFDSLMCLSGVHYPSEEMLGVTYHIHSTRYGYNLVLKVAVNVNDPLVPSVESIWKTADWHEREAWDMLGIKFEGHPNLTRILCPDDWEGFPLRKDYVQQDTYLGLETK
ncbi:MAG: NADH-quinone oxidoreductase subunit C [Balneolales bacterium]